MMYNYLSSPLSKWMIPYYIKKYDIDMNQYVNKKYDSFNDFFIRCRKHLDKHKDENALISPCDGYLSVYDISKDLKFRVKHVDYNLDTLLNDKKLAEIFNGGLCLVFRLAPHNYHRYIYIDDGIILRKKRINGVLHCVRPGICSNLPVYIMNTREYNAIKSEHFGYMVQMEVGALLVGRIRNNNSDINIHRYAEKGYFEFGGSTIIILFENNKILLDLNILNHSELGKETRVIVGQVIGTTIKQMQ